MCAGTLHYDVKGLAANTNMAARGRRHESAASLRSGPRQPGNAADKRACNGVEVAMKVPTPVRKTSLFLLIFCTGAAAAAGQTPKPADGQAVRANPPDAKKARVVRPPEIESLVAEAYYLPPEFAADALIRIAQSNRVADRRWKKELLESAFGLAAKAQEPVRLKSAAVGGYSVDTTAGYASYAFERRLDALSLRARAAREMLKVDKRRARELFGEIPPAPPLPPRRCEDALVYDVSDFYETLGAVAAEAFAAEEVEQGAQVRFVLPYIEAVSAHAQVAPALRVVAALKPTPVESLTLAGALARALEKIDADDRSFSYELTRGAMLSEAAQVAQALESREIPAGKLLAALRQYVRKNLRGDRCADSAVADERALAHLVKQANALFFKDDPLAPDDLKPYRVLGAAEIYEYWKSPEAARLHDLVKDLRFGFGPELRAVRAEGAGDDRPLTEAERQTPAWQQQLGQFLNKLESWDRTKERSEADYFHQRQVLYMALMELAPPGAARDLIVRSWVGSLEDRGLEGLSRIQWYLYADHLLRIARDAPPADRAGIFEAAVNSKNPTLALYAKMARLRI